MAERKITDSQQTESLDSIFVNDGGNLRQIPKEKAREALGITDAESNIDDLKSDISFIGDSVGFEKNSGKNKFDNTTILEAFTTGETQSVGSYIVVPIRLSPNTSYYVTLFANPSTGIALISKNINVASSRSDTISIGSSEWAREKVISTDDDGLLYIGAVSYGVNELIAALPTMQVQIEKGFVKTEYEPYTLVATSGVEKNARAIESIKDNISSGYTKIEPLFVEFSSKFWGGVWMPSVMSGNNMDMTISGNAGDTIVSVTASTPIVLSDITSTRDWFCGWFTANGIDYSIINIRKNSDSTVEIFPPLPDNVSDAHIGNVFLDGGETYAAMHLTEGGYKAYAQVLYNENPKYCQIGELFARYDPVFGDASPFTKYGGIVYNNPENTINPNISRFENPYRTYHSAIFDKSYEPHTNESGLKCNVDVTGKRGYVELYCGLSCTPHKIPEGQELYVELWLNGSLAHQKIVDVAYTQRICMDFEDADNAQIKVYCKKFAPIDGDSISINVYRAYWWNIENPTRKMRLFEKYDVVAQEFDSWGMFHNEIVAKELKRLISQDLGVTTMYENHSKNGQTSAWGKAWWFENVKKYNPTVGIYDFLINDTHSTKSTGFQATVAGPDGTEYNNLINREQYAENMTDIANLSIAHGIQPIFMRNTQYDDYLVLGNYWMSVLGGYNELIS